MDQVESLLKRPRAYDNIDGVAELVFGFMCLGFSLIAWLQLHTPESSVWNQMYTFLIYTAAMISIIHYGSKAIKTRITYRRTGFVEYRHDKYWVAVGIAAVVSALVPVGLYLAVRRHWEVLTPICLVGLALAALYIPVARTVRWKWATFSVMVAGPLAISALPADLVGAFANHMDLTSAIPAKAVGAYWLTFVVDGTALMISGGRSFWLYLRHTQAPAKETSEPASSDVQ